MDIINTIACGSNSDERHHVHFLRDGAIHSLSLADLDRQATAVAGQLHEIGIRPGDRIGVMAKNCLEWVILDLATLKLGGVLAGFETGRYQADVLIPRYDLKLLLVDQPLNKEGAGAASTISPATVQHWASRTTAPPSSTRWHGGYAAGDTAAIKFTSGSTGAPKGLEATVGSINDSLSSVQTMFHHGDDDNILIFLPLSLLQQRYWIYSALVYGHDVTISTLEYVFTMAQAVRPTVIMGVPAFFDAVKAQIESMSEAESCDPRRRREAIDTLVGERVRYLWTGSAPASRATLDFFNEASVPLFEGYGMNETCIVSKNHPGAHRVGSVGQVLPNKTVRFDAEGQLIVGAHHPVNTFYSWCSPGDNERVFLPSGEVRTGDLGYLDADGYLYILGRVDDVLAMSDGRNVHVRPIEENVKRCGGVHECVIYGAGQSYLTALISPANEEVADRAALESHIRLVNQTLPSEQQIRGLIIVPERFSIENDLLTSQFKPKRREIFRRYATEIAAIYER